MTSRELFIKREAAQLRRAEERRFLAQMLHNHPEDYACVKRWRDGYDAHIATLAAEEQNMIADGVHPSLHSDFQSQGFFYADLLFESLPEIHSLIESIQVAIPHGAGTVLEVFLRCNPDAPEAAVIPAFFHAYRVFRVGRGDDGTWLIYHPYSVKPEDNPVKLRTVVVD